MASLAHPQSPWCFLRFQEFHFRECILGIWRVLGLHEVCCVIVVKHSSKTGTQRPPAECTALLCSLPPLQGLDQVAPGPVEPEGSEEGPQWQQAECEGF